jgi:hypothetical protein
MNKNMCDYCYKEVEDYNCGCVVGKTRKENPAAFDLCKLVIAWRLLFSRARETLGDNPPNRVKRDFFMFQEVLMSNFTQESKAFAIKHKLIEEKFFLLCEGSSSMIREEMEKNRKKNTN